MPSDNLNDYFTYGKPITFGINLNLNRLYLTADFGGSIRSDIKKDFDYKITWRKGDKVTYAHGELLLGYNIYRNHRIGIIPYLGWSGIGFAPYSKEDKNYYENTENIGNYSLRYGVDFQFKWGYNKCNARKTLYGLSRKDYYMYTTISLGYTNPNLQEHLEDFYGSLWYLKLNIGYTGEFKFRSFLKQNWL